MNEMRPGVMQIIGRPWPGGYLHAKFQLDLSNRLATVHQRHRQKDRETDRTERQTDNGLIA